MFIKDFFTKLWDSAYSLNANNILGMLEVNSDAAFLDVGCDDGCWGAQVAEGIGTQKRHGIEIVDKRRVLAEKKGFVCTASDLNDTWSYEDESFDVIHSNQVIEHVTNLDHFLSEHWRLIKPGGYLIVSTENASSWCNVFASIMGWQIFSLTNLSCRQGGTGNPLAIHRGEEGNMPSWCHKTIFNFQGLIEFVEGWGFNVVEVCGAGYYPLPSKMGNIDPRHSHFISIKATKPVE